MNDEDEDKDKDDEEDEDGSDDVGDDISVVSIIILLNMILTRY